MMKEYKIASADIAIRCDPTIDDLIDVLEAKHRSYIPVIYALNKIDSISIEELDLLYRIPHACPISSEHGWNIDELLEQMWDALKLKRIYTKPKGLSLALVRPGGATDPLLHRQDARLLGARRPPIECSDRRGFCESCVGPPPLIGSAHGPSQCNQIHKSIVEQFRVAIVWGRSVKHNPQRVGLTHELEDEDIRKCPSVGVEGIAPDRSNHGVTVAVIRDVVMVPGHGRRVTGGHHGLTHRLVTIVKR